MRFVAAIGLFAMIAAGFLALRQPTIAAEGALTTAQKAEVETIVRDYILANPEIIPEAVTILQQRQRADLIDARRADIETPYESAWAGDADADVVLVEFFDFNCPYCRQSNEDVQRLLRDVDGLKVVWRDFPVLGPASREAAEAAIVAAREGRYRDFHDGMFADGRRVSSAKTEDLIAEAGLNVGQTKRSMAHSSVDAEIDKNLAMGRALGITGTPAYVIGDRILDGAVGYDQLKAAVEAARAS
ncbi:MAG: DsbA family protein [Pacificimonas sp.]